MSKKILLTFIIILTLCGCNNNTEKEKNTTTTSTSTTSTTTTKTTSTSTTTTISSTTITSKSTTTTTTKTTTKKVEKQDFPKVAEISGTKKTVGISSKGYTIYEIDGVTYIDGYLIANKTYFLPSTYYPLDTHTNAKNQPNTCNDCINNTAYKAWKQMKADASSLGLSINITSGYRPYNTQKTIYNRNVAKDGQAKTDTYSARPGSSEHQSGLAFDLNSISDAFANTNEGKWVNSNCYKYGFIIRYPKGKQDITGYKYESWHLRYVGTDLSYKLYNNGNWLTMEEYFGITSKYE